MVYALTGVDMKNCPEGFRYECTLRHKQDNTKLVVSSEELKRDFVMESENDDKIIDINKTSILMNRLGKMMDVDVRFVRK